MNGRVTVKDAVWRRILDRVRAIDRRVVKVGVIQGKGAEREDGGISMAALAAVHEYGTRDGRIPERSFVRRTFKEQGRELRAMTEKLARAVVREEMSTERALGLLGAWGAAAIRRTIRAHIPPPNRPATIAAKKGKTTPLVDTGQLVNSISWQVEDRGR